MPRMPCHLRRPRRHSRLPAAARAPAARAPAARALHGVTACAPSSLTPIVLRAGLAGDPLEWYNEIPVVSRLYLTGSFITTAACALDLVSPFSLYFNFKLIFHKGQVHALLCFTGTLGSSLTTLTLFVVQVWRLFTNFLFFGTFSLDFIFHMYFLYVNPAKLSPVRDCTVTRPFCARVRYCRLLEEGSFRGRTADFVWMLFLGWLVMTVGFVAGRVLKFAAYRTGCCCCA